MKRKLLVGDRVEVIGNMALGSRVYLRDKNTLTKGREGIVRVIQSNDIGVQLFFPFEGHTLFGALETATGFWFWEKELRLLPNKKERP